MTAFKLPATDGQAAQMRAKTVKTAAGALPGLPERQGLYDPRNEHDACGVGFIANMKNVKSHKIVEDGLAMLENLTHRGAVGADPLMGDGAGVLVQLPDRFFREEMAKQGIELPPPGQYGVGHWFMPQDAALRAHIDDIIRESAASEGLPLIGFRDVPVDNSSLSKAPEIAAAEPADPAPQHVAAPDMQDATGTVAAGDEAAAAKPAKPAAKAQSATPARAPVAPQRPSDQPVNVVGEVKPDQVASIDPGTAASGSWSVQIASQPTADSAQSTYQDLARRYASVLQGRSASIVKAEVAGKGTFYRVRVPAQSRNDAVALCNSYKAAGGNCFVSK